MQAGLLEPRLYRAAFAPALLTLVVLMFSLQDAPRGLSPELAPPTFSASRALATAAQLTSAGGARLAGTEGDARTAELAATRLAEAGFKVSRYGFDATTQDGKHDLVNVVGVRPGPSDRRLVVAAARTGAPGRMYQTGAAETGVLLELARVIQSRNFSHSLVLASVDGDVGAAELARGLRRPVDGAIVIRNIAAESIDEPVLDTYDSRLRPDARFARTISRIAGIELNRYGGGRSTFAQLARLAFPVALGEQATFPDQGIAAVALSPGGEPLTRPDWSRISAVSAAGRIVLRTLTTFDDDFRPAPPAAAPLELGGKLIPGWALIVFLGTLLLPLVVVAVDGWARARRWREGSARGFMSPALVLAWLLTLFLLLRVLGLTGAITAPELPVDRALSGSAGPVVVGLLAGALALLGTLVCAAGARQITEKGGEAGFAAWIAIAGVAVFSVSPVAAGFLIPLLHVVAAMLLAGVRPGRAQVWLLALIGLLPMLAVALYYPAAFDLSLFGSVRFATQLVAGGFVGLFAGAAACVTAAAVGTALLHLHWTAPGRRAQTNDRSSLFL